MAGSLRYGIFSDKPWTLLPLFVQHEVSRVESRSVTGREQTGEPQ
jgi:hypothetical protein